MSSRIVCAIGLLCLLCDLSLDRVYGQTHFQCQPIACSTLTPSTLVDDPRTNDCAYHVGNLWWVDYVAGSLAWRTGKPTKPVIVAVFDDGAFIGHEDIRNQLWTKGETSGNRLEVVSAATDCDRDTVLLQVRVLGEGVVCHQGTRSCFTQNLPTRTNAAPAERSLP